MNRGEQYRCSFHSMSAYYSHTQCRHLAGKGKRKVADYQNPQVYFTKSFHKAKFQCRKQCINLDIWNDKKKSTNILTKFVLSLRYRESSLTPNTYPHSLSLIQVTTGDVLAHLQGSKNTKTANSLDHKLTIIFWFHLSLYANTRHEHF